MTTATPSNINTKSSIETKAETRIATLIKRPTKTRGLGSWFTSVDHKRIALLYIATALFFFLFGGVEALLIRMQLFSPNS